MTCDKSISSWPFFLPRIYMHHVWLVLRLPSARHSIFTGGIIRIKIYKKKKERKKERVSRLGVDRRPWIGSLNGPGKGCSESPATLPASSFPLTPAHPIAVCACFFFFSSRVKSADTDFYPFLVRGTCLAVRVRSVGLADAPVSSPRHPRLHSAF